MLPKTVSILVVDDDEDDFLIVSHLLRDVQGICFLLEWASSYQGAKHYLSRKRPDVILLDYCLSAEHNGIDLARWLWARGDDIPILMVSGNDYSEMSDITGLAEVVDGYRSKRDLTGKSLETDLLSVIFS